MSYFDSKPAPIDILKTHKESTPEWLTNFKPGDSLSLLAFMNSRTVLIPPMDTDALKLFARAGAAHCFIYCHQDGVTELVKEALKNPVFGIFNHYVQIAEERPSFDLPDPVVPRDELPSMLTASTHLPTDILLIYERKPSIGPESGPKRIAVFALDRDCFETYIQLYLCGTKSAFGLVLDHRFHESQVVFGEANPVETLKSIADRTDLPDWLLATPDTEWAGYTRVSKSIRGGFFRSKRFLWQRK